MQRAMVPTMIAVVAGNSNMCPSSPADPHAQTSVEVTVFATCDKVLQEIEARIQANSQGSWLDPHNGGHYFLDSSNSQQLDAHRETGSASIPQGGPFRDNLRFKLHQNGANCEIESCSASQVASVTDFSGGYCNLRNLFCGSDAGCTTQKHDFQFKEGNIDLSPGRGKYPGASADASMCIVPVALHSSDLECEPTCDCSCHPGTELGSIIDCHGVVEGHCPMTCGCARTWGLFQNRLMTCCPGEINV